MHQLFWPLETRHKGEIGSPDSYPGVLISLNGSRNKGKVLDREIIIAGCGPQNKHELSAPFVPGVKFMVMGSAEGPGETPSV